MMLNGPQQGSNTIDSIQMIHCSFHTEAKNKIAWKYKHLKMYIMRNPDMSWVAQAN
uniref:Uncharacterized protein LOC8268590 isoform X2 n=1 Tax=Rhizophora mucronata TaxID=61149 RepID=A0A2P2JZK8_RHIMU